MSEWRRAAKMDSIACCLTSPTVIQMRCSACVLLRPSRAGKLDPPDRAGRIELSFESRKRRRAIGNDLDVVIGWQRPSSLAKSSSHGPGWGLKTHGSGNTRRLSTVAPWPIWSKITRANEIAVEQTQQEKAVDAAASALWRQTQLFRWYPEWCLVQGWWVPKVRRYSPLSRWLRFAGWNSIADKLSPGRPPPIRRAAQDILLRALSSGHQEIQVDSDAPVVDAWR